MSRIGRQKIEVPKEVDVNIDAENIVVKGPKGELSLKLHPKAEIILKENEITVNRKNDKKISKSIHGLYQRLISNMITGVSKGFEKKLEYKGVGYRAQVSDNKLILNVGYSHPVEIAIPDGIEINVKKNIISVNGINKQLVGQTAAKIRSVRKPEPYKGKGIKYVDEISRRKAGKAAKSAAGATGA